MNRFWKLFSLRRSPNPQIDSIRPALTRSSSKVAVSEDSSMQVAAFYRGLIYISSQIAKLPWEVKDANNNIIENDISRLLSLLANPELDAMAFRLWAVQNAIIHGNAYAEIERTITGKPIALWPIRSRDVCIERDKSGNLVYRVLGGTEGGGDVFLEPKNVFHLKNFHTKDGLVGQGIVAYAKDVLGISLGADQMAGNLFGNGGIPSGIIKVKGALSPEAAKRLKESWDAAHGGRKSSGTAVLEEEASYEPISMDPEVLQFLESRKFSVLEIARFLGLPPTKLFDTTAATYSNQEQSNLEVATDVLDAWACNLEIQADIKILNKRYGGLYSELDLYSVFRGDMTTRSNYFSKMMQTAAITPNEIRKREGMAPYEEGDEFYVAVNNYTPVSRMDEVIDSQISKGKDNNNPASTGLDQETAQLNKAAIRFLER